MASDDIQGQITDEDGNPLSGVPVWLFSQDNPSRVKETTTDSNGNYIFERHPDGDGTTQNWHVTTAVESGGQRYNAFSKPYVSASINAIPDSVVNLWPVDEGSGTTFNPEIGAISVSWNNITSWISGNFVGGAAVDIDASDVGSATLSFPSGSMTTGITLSNADGSTGAEIIQWGQDTSSSNRRQLRFYSQTGGEFAFNVTNDSGTEFRPTTTITDNSEHRLLGILDVANSEAKLVDNGSIVDNVSISGSFNNTRNDFNIGARADGSAGYAEILDEPIIANEAFGSVEIQDDYARQPWS